MPFILSPSDMFCGIFGENELLQYAGGLQLQNGPFGPHVQTNKNIYLPKYFFLPKKIP